MTQTSRLVIEISTEAAKRNAEIIRQELQRMNAAGSNTINITNNISTNMNQAARSMDATRSAARDLIGMLGGMAVAYKAISASDDYTNLNNRLRLVTDTQKELSMAVEDTFAIAQRAGAEWGATASIYQKVQYNSEKLGLSQEQVGKITESISKSISNSGSSAQAAAAALYQLGQSFDKSSLNGDEFVSMSENAGYLMEVFAKGLGVTRAELKEMSSQGQLTTDKMVAAIQKMSGSIEKDFNKTSLTIGQNLTKIQNAVVKFVGESNGGAAGALADSLGRVAENIELIANVGGAAVLGLITKAMVSGTIAGRERIAVMITERNAALAASQAEVQRTGVLVLQTRANAAATLAEVNMARAEYNSAASAEARRVALGRLTTAQIADRAATYAATQASIANTEAKIAETAATSRLAAAKAGVIGLLGGPAGLIGLAVAAGAAFYLMRDSSDAAKDSIADQSLSIEELRKKYAGLNAETLKLKAIDAGDRIKEENDKIADSFASLDSRVYKLLSGGGTQPQAAALQGYLEDLKAGGEQAAKALTTLESKKVFTQGQIKSVAELGANVKASRDEISRQNQILDIATNKNQQAANAVDAHADSQNNLKNKTNEATEALKKYLSQQQSSAWKTQFAATYSAKNNLPTDFSNMVAEARQANDNKPLTQQQTNDLWKYYQAQQAVTELDKRRNDAIKAGEKAVTDREKAEKKAHDEYLKQLEKQADMRKQISSQYANTLEQNRFNFADAKTDILGAGFSEKDQTKYVGLAQRYYQRIDDEYFKHLNLELKEYTWTEQQKLDYAYKMDKKILTNSIENLDEINEAKREALDRAYAYQSGQIALHERQDLLSTKQYYLSEIEYMKERYKLEREEIAQTKNKSDAWKAAKLAASVAAENEDFAQRQAAADLQYKGLTGELSGTGAFDGLDKEMEARQAIIENALKYQVITYQDYKDQLYAIDEDYRTKSIALTMSYGESIAGSYADIAKRVFGEQSNAYKAMFTIQKAASIAQSIMAIQTGIAQAAANPFPYNLAAMASVAAATANIVGNIQAIRLEGFSAGGYTGSGGKYDVAGLVHKGEVVWSQDDIKRAGGVGTVEAMRTGTRVDNAIAAQGRTSYSGGNVYVYNNTSSAVSTRKDDSGNTYITIDDVRREIAKNAPAAVANDLSRGPNTPMGKAMRQNYKVERQF